MRPQYTDKLYVVCRSFTLRLPQQSRSQSTIGVLLLYCILSGCQVPCPKLLSHHISSPAQVPAGQLLLQLRIPKLLGQVEQAVGHEHQGFRIEILSEPSTDVCMCVLCSRTKLAGLPSRGQNMVAFEKRRGPNYRIHDPTDMYRTTRS